MVRVALRDGQGVIDRQPVLTDEMRDDGLAIANNLAVVVDVGKLSARRVRCVEDVLMRERNLGELEEGVNLEPVAVVIGDAAECGPGVEREHRKPPLR
jgi:hypothetical protein